MDFNMCRICLGHGYQNIFEMRDSELISTKVTRLANVNISPSDGLTDKICIACLNKLDNCKNFINMCQENDMKLRAKLHKTSNENSQTDLEIDFDNESYSFKIENDSFKEYHLRAEYESDNQALSQLSVKKQVTLYKKTNNKREKKTRKKILSKKQYVETNDKKKAVEQQCFTCGKVMSSRFRLKTHMRTHTGERPFTCSICNKTFSLEQNLKVHMRVHTGEKPLQCPVCGETFAQTAGLAAHKRKHTGQTPYHCVLCPRSFRTNGHLQYHVRRHTGEKNFECDTCSKAFITRSGLKQHLLTHTGDRPHVCSVCGKRMTRASHVKRHKIQAHQEIQIQFACDQCPEKFNLKHVYEKHKEVHENGKPVFES